MLLTSNNTRELTEALKRRCLYLWLDYPELEHELAIVQLHTPDLDDAIARKLVEIVAMVRELDLKKPPSIAESIDWARALLLLGADDIDDEVFAETMSVIVKHRTDLDVVAERVGMKLGPSVPRPPASRRAALYGGDRAGGRRRPASRAHLLAVRRGAARRGRGGRHERAARRVRGPRARCRGREPEDFREALAATLAKSQEDRRIFELVFDRFFFRAAELAAVREGVTRGRRRSTPAGAELDLETLRQQIAAALRDGNEAPMRDLARLAIAAFGRQGEGSGVIGVDVQRIRRALGLRAEPQPDLPDRRPARATACRATRSAASRRCCAASSSARQIERTESLPPARPLNELDRALPSGPLQDLAAVHRVVAQLKRRLKTQGQESRGRKRHAHVDVRRTMRASLRDRRRAGRPASTSRSARGGRRSTCCATSRRSVTSASVFFLSRPARAARLVSQDALVRLHRAHQRGHRRLRARARLQGRQRGDRRATPASPTSAATPTTAACGASSATLVEDDLHPRATVIVLGDARTNGRDPRADVFATIAAAPGARSG